MSKNSVVSLTLQLKGQQASAELKRIAADQLNAVKKINTEQQKLAPIQAGQINSAKKFSDELRKQGQAFVAQKREALAVDTARKLGIRTEQQINAEIKKTHNSYAQLSILQRQGVVTAKDMERAYAAMKSRVAALNGELGKTVQTEKQIQQIQKTGGSGGMNLMQRGGAVAGATVVGGAIISNALQKPRDYAQLMTYITATATGGQGLTAAQRLEKTGDFEGFIKNAVRNGGGKREDVAAALNELIASGKYDESNVSRALLSSSKTAFAAQSQQNSELVAKQEQANKLSQDIIGKLNSLINVTQQNKPLPFNASGLLGDISNHAAAEEKRQGAFIPWKIAPK